jgi:hypothetical protein
MGQDPRKYDRAKELLEMNEVITKAKKVITPPSVSSLLLVVFVCTLLRLSMNWNK